MQSDDKASPASKPSCLLRVAVDTRRRLRRTGVAQQRDGESSRWVTSAIWMMFRTKPKETDPQDDLAASRGGRPYGC